MDPIVVGLLCVLFGIGLIVNILWDIRERLPPYRRCPRCGDPFTANAHDCRDGQGGCKVTDDGELKPFGQGVDR